MRQECWCYAEETCIFTKEMRKYTKQMNKYAKETHMMHAPQPLRICKRNVQTRKRDV